jgi:hypothetical protein
MHYNVWLALIPTQQSPTKKCHESTVFPQVGQIASSRLQDRAPPRQGLRDLQKQSTLQGPPALNLAAPQAIKGRQRAAFLLSATGTLPVGPHELCRVTPGIVMEFIG